MKKFTLLIAAMLCSALFQSCQKDEISVENVSENTIKVVNGRLTFRDFAHFEREFKGLMENVSADRLEMWEGQFANYTSMRTAYSRLNESDFEKIAGSMSVKGYESLMYIREENGEKEATMVTEHPVFARMFNNEGIVIIAKDAFRLEKDKLIKVPNYTEVEIQKVVKGLRSSKVSTLGITRQEIIVGKNLRTEKTLDLDRSCHNVYDDKYAFKAIFILFGTIVLNNDWQGDFGGLFNTIFVFSQHRKKTLGIWFAKRAPVLSASGELTLLDDNGYTSYYIGPVTAQNEDEVFIPYGWGR